MKELAEESEQHCTFHNENVQARESEGMVESAHETDFSNKVHEDNPDSKERNENKSAEVKQCGTAEKGLQELSILSVKEEGPILEPSQEDKESTEHQEPTDNSIETDFGSEANQSRTKQKEILEISTLSVKEPSSLAFHDSSCGLPEELGGHGKELVASNKIVDRKDHSKDTVSRRRSAHGLRRSSCERRSEGGASTTPPTTPSFQSDIDRAKAELIVKIHSDPEIWIEPDLVEDIAAAAEIDPDIPLSLVPDVPNLVAHAVPVPLNNLAGTVLTNNSLYRSYRDPAPQQRDRKCLILILGAFFLVVAGLVALAVSVFTQQKGKNTGRDCVSDPVTEEEIKLIRQDIEVLVDTYHPSINLAAKFVRLGFHACVGGCNGCIDMADPENSGLEMPVEFLDPIVSRYENECISRADIWALASLVGADLTQSQENFPMLWVGRKNCDAKDPLKGPTVKMADPYMDIHHLLAYFKSEFGFDAQQTVALMGAHSIGKVHAFNSGFMGSGWDLEGERLDNEYYRQLQDHNWNQVKAKRYQWAGGYGGSGQADLDGIVMLNVDVALVKDFSKYQETDGAVTCNFGPEGEYANRGNGYVPAFPDDTKACPYSAATRSIVEEYRNSNSMFLRDFSDAFNQLLIHGYDTGEDCNGDNPCLIPVSRDKLNDVELSLSSIELADRINACKLVASSLFVDPSVWDDPGSPPVRACKWIAEIDPMEVDFLDESLRDKIKQRLLLVWFYYYTLQGSKSSWPRCNPPETGEGPGCLHQALESYGFQGETFDQKMIEPAFRWLTYTDECRWAGVKCNDVGQITHLQLGGYGLEAAVPAELVHLDLQVLDLQNNKLYGTLPPTLVSSPSKLQTLHLHQNRLTGTIPSNWCSDPRERLPLEKLNLAQNQLTGQLPFCLNSLQQLKDFSVMHNQLTGIIPELGGDLASLEEVHLAWNKFEGSIPDSLCQTDSVSELSADCMESPASNYVKCHCCTKCCDPEEGANFCTVVITRKESLAQNRNGGPF